MGRHFPRFLPVLSCSNVPSRPWIASNPKQLHVAYQPAPLIPPDSDLDPEEENEVVSYERRDFETYELEPERSFQSFLGRWASGPDTYDLSPAPLQRSYPFAGNMSPTEMTGLHCATMKSLRSVETSRGGFPWPQPQPQPPQVRVFETDEIRLKLLASQKPRKPNAEASAPDLAMPPESQPRRRGNLISFSQDENVKALKELKLDSRKKTVARLQSFDDLSDGVEYVKCLSTNSCQSLLTEARKCQTTNPEASQVLALLFLISLRWPPDPDEFLDLLPDAWPPAMEQWRLPCLENWNMVRRSQITPKRDEVFLQLRDRYRYR